MKSDQWHSLYHFVLDQRQETSAEFPELYCLGDYYFHCCLNTTVDFSENGDRSVLLFGDVVHTLEGYKQHLSKEILDKVDNLNDLLDFEYNLGGKYIILYKTNKDLFLIPDATCSIPVYYNTKESGCTCSDFCEYIANRYGYKEDKTLRKIREYSDISQAMPYNITTYSEVLALLPNHFLSVYSSNSTRIIIPNAIKFFLDPVKFRAYNIIKI